MSTQTSTFSRFEAVPGMVLMNCPSLPDVRCPLCANTDLAFLMGKVSFSATISGDDLFADKPQPLVGVVCSQSHIFFLREKDAVPGKELRSLLRG